MTLFTSRRSGRAALALVVQIIVLPAVLRESVGAPYRSGPLMRNQLTPQDAKVVVQRFEGNAGLSITIGSYPDFSAPPDSSVRYILYAGTAEYGVCAYNANQISKLDLAPSWDYHDKNPKVVQKSESECRDIAVKYLKSHYPNPNILNSKIMCDPQYSGRDAKRAPLYRAYDYQFLQMNSNGSTGPSYCDVFVDSRSGFITNYAAGYYPLQAAGVPTLSGDQAVAAAMLQIGVTAGVPSGVPRLCVSKPNALGTEDQFYALRITGDNSHDNMIGYTWDVKVDADTGLIIDSSFYEEENAPVLQPAETARMAALVETLRQRVEWAVTNRATFEYFGHKCELVKPSFIINGIGYLPVGYICSSLDAGHLAFADSHSFSIVSKSDVIDGAASLGVLEVNGAKIGVSAAPRYMFGEWYVPVDGVAKFTHGNFSVDPTGRIINYDP